MTPEILVAFDIDDTLYKEREYVMSARRYISDRIARIYGGAYPQLTSEAMMKVMEPYPVHGPGAFDALVKFLPEEVSRDYGGIPRMVRDYRTHPNPAIRLRPDAERLLRRLNAEGIATAVITDGTVRTQTSKARALGVTKLVSPALISVSEAVGSEKYSPLPFLRMMSLMPGVKKFVYIADNIAKDFYWPRRLGWLTIALADSGNENIFPQIIAPSPVNSPAHFPDMVVKSLDELRF